MSPLYDKLTSNDERTKRAINRKLGWSSVGVVARSPKWWREKYLLEYPGGAETWESEYDAYLDHLLRLIEQAGKTQASHG